MYAINAYRWVKIFNAYETSVRVNNGSDNFFISAKHKINVIGIKENTAIRSLKYTGNDLPYIRTDSDSGTPVCGVLMKFIEKRLVIIILYVEVIHLKLYAQTLLFLILMIRE